MGELSREFVPGSTTSRFACWRPSRKAEPAQRRILDGLGSEEQKALLKFLARLVEFNADIGRTASNRSEQEKRPIIVALRRDSGGAASASARARNQSR